MVATSLITLLIGFGSYLLIQDLKSLINQEKRHLELAHRSAQLLIPRQNLEGALATKNSQSPSDSQLSGLLNQIQAELDIQGHLHVLYRPHQGQVKVIASSHSSQGKGDILQMGSLGPNSLFSDALQVSDIYSFENRRWMASVGPLPSASDQGFYLAIQTDRSAFYFQLLVFVFHYLFLGLGLVVIGLFTLNRVWSSSKKRLSYLEEAYSTLLDESADSVLLLDDKGRIKKANASASTLFQWPQKEMLSQNFCVLTAAHFSFIPLDTQKTILKSTLEGAERFRAKAKIVFKDESVRYVQFSSSPTEEGMGALVILHDITNDVMREQELLHSQNQLKQQNLKLQQQMITDPLTQTLNKQYLQHILRPQNLRWLNAENSTMLVIDLDNFKSINDAKGHAFGDQILKSFGTFLRNFFRRSDKIIRYGGDEFVVILAGTQMREATRIAQNFVDALRKAQFEDGIHLTASVGVSQLCSDESGRDWFERADAAMYDAKRSGKNAFKVQEAQTLEILN